MAVLVAAILAVPTSSYGQTVVPLAVQPADNWNLNVGASTGGVCHPLNPMELNFLDLPTGGGPGVWMASSSNTFGCCSCIRRSREYPLGFALNTVTSGPRLQGFYDASRGLGDTFSIASIRVELVSTGFVAATQVFATEIRPNNNCAAGGPVTLLPSGTLTFHSARSERWISTRSEFISWAMPAGPPRTRSRLPVSHSSCRKR